MESDAGVERRACVDELGDRARAESGGRASVLDAPVAEDGSSDATHEDMTVDDVREAAMRLDATDRALLIADLQDSIEHPETGTKEEIDAAWRTEIQRRAAELQADPSIGLTWGEVKARIEEDRRKGFPGRTGRPIPRRTDAADEDQS